jgi:hypothetical protein
VATLTIKLSDFDDRIDIFPISNPDIFSQSQRIAMAQEMMALVQSNPDVHGPTVYTNLTKECMQL